jgi:hypothetical protein
MSISKVAEPGWWKAVRRGDGRKEMQEVSDPKGFTRWTLKAELAVKGLAGPTPRLPNPAEAAKEGVLPLRGSARVAQGCKGWIGPRSCPTPFLLLWGGGRSSVGQAHPHPLHLLPRSFRGTLNSSFQSLTGHLRYLTPRSPPTFPGHLNFNTS